VTDVDDLGPEYRVTYPVNVVLTRCMFNCSACGQWKPAAEVGLRCMGDGVIRNQPQCIACRSKRTPLHSVK
jgi:hypothetical protein